MSFLTNNKAIKKYKNIQTKIEDFKNIELNASPVYDDRYIKTKIRTSGDKVYINFRSLNMPEDGIECKSFTVISTDSIFVNKGKYYLQVYLDKTAYKIIDKQMIGYLGENPSEINEDQIL